MDLEHRSLDWSFPFSSWAVVALGLALLDVELAAASHEDCCWAPWEMSVDEHFPLGQ